MTTRHFRFSRNLNIENDIFILHGKACCDLWGAEYGEFDWSDKSESTDRAVALLSKRIAEKIPKLEHWLFIGHRSWQEDSRIVRHWKLWRALERQGIKIPVGDNASEVLTKSDRGLKYFGSIRFDINLTNSIAQILRSGWEVQVLAMENTVSDFANEFLLRGGWDDHGHSPAQKILDLICQREIIAYLPLGWFDDRESGCALIGQKSLISRCFPEIVQSLGG